MKVRWKIRDRPNFASIKVRKQLPARRAPYFHLISLGRALGYQKKSTRRCYWIVRARKAAGGYTHVRLGMTDDLRKADGEKRLSFAQALEKAEAWFSTSPGREGFSQARAIMPSVVLAPASNDRGYTVCHAMHDLIAWKRMMLSPEHLQNTIYAINLHIVPYLGNILVDDFGGGHYQSFVQHMLEAPSARWIVDPAHRDKIDGMDVDLLRRKRNRLNRVSRILREALKMAWENSKTDNNRAWRTVRLLPLMRRPKQTFLSRQQCKALLEVCPSDLKRLVLGALYTGCRSSELLRLNAEDVAKEGYGINVVSSKGGRPRFVFLPDEGMAFFLSLARGKNPCDPLFTRDNSTPVRLRSDFRYRFKVAVREAALPVSFGFHGLRHTYASQLVAAGTPMKVISEQLGHRDIKMVHEVYGHLAPQIVESEIQKRFQPVNATLSARAKRAKPELTLLRKKLFGPNWRPYAKIRD